MALALSMWRCIFISKLLSPRPALALAGVLFFLTTPALGGADDFEHGVIRVRGRRRPPQASETRLSGAEAMRVAGGAGDVVRALGALPGATASSDYLANLMVRGGGLEDNLVLLDGFVVSAPFHFGGIESIFHPGAIEGVDFLPGGFDARYGDTLGGVLELRTRRPDAGIGGQAGLSMVQASVLGHAVGQGERPWGVQGWARRGWFDLVLDPNSSLTGLPRYGDYAAQTRGPLAGGDLAVLVFGSQDSLRVATAKAGATESRWDSEAHSLGLAWENPIPSGTLLVKLSASTSRQVISLGQDLSLRREPYTWLASLDGDWDLGGGEHRVSAGTQWQQTNTILQGRFNRLPVEFGSGLNFNGLAITEVDALGRKGVSSAWVTDAWQLLPAWSLGVGGRLDRVDLTSEFHFSPRLSVEWKAWPDGTLRATQGDYFQSPQPLETVPGWTAGIAGSSLARAWSLGAEQKLGPWGSLRLEGWRRDFERLVPSVPVPITGTSTVTLNAAATGASEGIETMWRLPDQGVFFGWVSYAWTNTLRGSPWGGYHEADFSQPHVFNTVGNLALGSGWELGARWRLASGIPYTPVISRSYDSIAGRWKPIFGGVNSARLDSYQRLDLRLQKEWARAQVWRLYVDIFNVSDQPNITSVTYEDDYSDIRRVRQFPRFAFFGAEVQF